ncbi:Ger(x)C family spore germination protein [Paenibacillus radicis (ex Xue et al. 2023)]|uniref:Ger(X)C family spore germination protein n=1 Tax=Paenibacillus radicis (ex Xue et al. 2023) TaxID=2972489 RepID=A0ABT1YDZ3_9BACL|nr:Ger(x)C family spore germination protein [Paenibacillus radicis (ex Xue et al. 2023)]MCR8631404.1 Ger(x)C family spore germination protein [Paenibacillus radicis (ex Xue et al. 2023)]
MKRAIASCLLLMLLLLLMTGCWSRHELNDLNIVVGMGIDKSNGKYKVTVQTVNPGQVASKKGSISTASPVVTYEEVGTTIPEALSRMTVKAPRHLYFAHLRMVIIGEEAAREGISKQLDFLSRNMEMRTDFFFVIARDTDASEVLKINSPMDPIPANNIYTKLDNSDKLWSATGSMTLNHLLQDLGKEGKSPSITGLEIVGDRNIGKKTTNGQYIEPPVILQYAGMAAFKSDRMVGWLDENDTKALNYVQNSVYQTTGFIPCPKGKGNITMQVIRADTFIKASIQNGKPEFDVYLRIEQDISDAECSIDLSQAAIVPELKKLTDNKIKAFIEGSVQKIQKNLGTDIYGFGEVLHQQYPKVWHQIKDWNKVFTTVKVRAHVNSILRRMGTILQPVDYTNKE